MRRCRELLQRRDVVGDPDAAPMGGDDEISVARMDQDVVGAHRRIVVHELLPVPAAIERDEQPELGAHVEQILVLRILSDDLHVSVLRQVVRQRLECLAVIARDEHVGLQVVAAMAVHRHVGRGRIEVRCVNPRDPILMIRWQIWQVLSNFRERLPAVAAHLQVAVVGSSPDDPGHHGGFGDRDDRAVRHDSVVL